jgi:hypothetical protein
MKTNYTTLRSSSIGTVAAVLMAVTSQTGMADERDLIWAGHFKEGYSSPSSQGSSSTFRSAGSGVEEKLIWAGHFQQGYDGSSDGISVANRSRKPTSLRAKYPKRESGLPWIRSRCSALRRGLCRSATGAGRPLICTLEV